MHISLDALSIEVFYYVHNTIKKLECHGIKRNNYLGDVIHVDYHRTNDSIDVIVKPVVPLHIQKIAVILQSPINDDTVCFANGYQSWTYTDVLHKQSLKRKPRFQFVTANQDNSMNPPHGRRGVVQSEMFFLFGDSSSQDSVLLGQLPGEHHFRQFVSFQLDYRTKRAAISWDIDRLIDSDEEYCLDIVGIFHGTAWTLLKAYADIIASRLTPHYNKTMRKGWCSWYYYYDSITKDEILANVKYAKDKSIPFDFIQIDDGYQTTIGEWVNVKTNFTASMRHIAEKIKESGFSPGIWYSPFIVSKYSKVFKECFPWILKDDAGKPVVAGFNPSWGGYYYAVDVTQPAVLSWIDDTINTLLYEWGFEYLKLDFMYAASLPGVRQNKTITRCEALIHAIARIRKASGNAFLLGCGMPLQTGIGFVDAMRIGPDTAPQWGRTKFDILLNSDSGVSTRSAIRSSIYRSFMHNRFWINDPDCLMLRKHKTNLTDDERHTLFNVITALGGMLVVSDRLPDYTTSELELLMQACALFDASQHGDINMYNVLGDSVGSFYNTNGMAVLLNLTDEERTASLADDILQHYTVYSSEKGGEHSCINRVHALMPHSSKLFHFSK